MDESQEIPTEQQIEDKKNKLHNDFIDDFEKIAADNQEKLDELSNKPVDENAPEVEFDEQGRVISYKSSESD